MFIAFGKRNKPFLSMESGIIHYNDGIRRTFAQETVFKPKLK
jgi:hypothetical protein